MPNVQTTLWELKHDPEVNFTHGDVHARAWECEFEKPICNNDYDNATIAKWTEL